MEVISKKNRQNIKGRSGVKVRLGNLKALFLVLGLSVLLAACSSSSSSSTQTSVSKTTAVNSNTGQSSSNYAGLNAGKLGSLTNYTAELDANGATFSFKVHSSTDWEMLTGTFSTAQIDSSSTIFNISGSSYTYQPVVNGASVTYTWKKNGPANSYAQSAYPAYAKSFAGLARVTGVKLVQAGSCSQAGQSGEIWKTEPSAASAVAPNIFACVSTSSGVLLSYDLGKSSSIYGQAASMTESFRILSIGNVPAITVP